LEKLISFLRQTEIFSRFSPEEIRHIAENCERRTYELGDTVIQAGDIAKGLYLIRSGRIRLFRETEGREKSSGICKSGESFAELSLIKEERIEYSARASDDSEILCFPARLLRSIMEGNKDIREHLTKYTVMKVCGNILIPRFHLHPAFSTDEITDIVRSIGIRRVPADSNLLIQEDTENRNVYLVRSGQFRIVFREGEKEYPLRMPGPGEIFGEKAAVTDAPQPATVKAAEESLVLLIPRQTVRLICERNPSLAKVMEKRIQLLDADIDRCLSLLQKKSPLFRFNSGNEKGKHIRRFPLVRQAESADCGPACLAMVCRHFQIPVSTVKLAEMSKVSAEGASLDSLSRTAENLGLTARALKSNYQSLMGSELPLIAHWKGYHYVVICGISESYVQIADPAKGFEKISRSEFERGWTGYCIQFPAPEQSGQFAGKKAARPSPWRRFLHYLLPYKKHLGDILFAAFIIQILGLIPPVIIQNILDRVIVHQSFDLLNIMICGLAVSMFFKQITGFVSSYLMNFMIRKLDFHMMSNFYRHVLSLPLDFFAKRKTGDIIARFNENNTIRRFMTEGSISTILNTIMVFSYFIIMFLYNAELTLLLMAFLPPIILLTLAAVPKYKDYARKIFFAGADAQSLLVETLSSAEIVKGMGNERSMRMKWEKKYADTLNIRYRSTIFSALIGSLGGILQAATHLTLLWVGTGMVMKQELSIGQLMAFNALIGSVMSPLMGLVGIWDEFQQTMVSMERLGDLLELEPEQKNGDTSRIVLPQLRGNIRFENVFFRYGEQPFTLKNINLTIPAGSTVAVVGASGSGKTSLARLLTGFYKVGEGKIFVDDYELNLLDMTYYRARIGYVMQDNALFSGTVSENIALGDAEADMRKVHEVARLADADGFIRNLPAAYEQVVGERGMGLSGGQIQRICIARALYHDPDLIILDEATSSLDSESEQRIRNNMKKILKGRTALIIAHRLSTIKDADKIVVLYEGSIAEEGNHEELLRQKGMYYHLVHQQTFTELAA
jgi:ATP-binding cassette subfamily B protein